MAEESQSKAESRPTLRNINRTSIRALNDETTVKPNVSFVCSSADDIGPSSYNAVFSVPEGMASLIIRHDVVTANEERFQLRKHEHGENKVVCTFERNVDPTMTCEMIRQVLIRRISDPLVISNYWQAEMNSLTSRLGRQATAICQSGTCTVS